MVNTSHWIMDCDEKEKEMGAAGIRTHDPRLHHSQAALYSPIKDWLLHKSWEKTGNEFFSIWKSIRPRSRFAASSNFQCSCFRFFPNGRGWRFTTNPISTCCNFQLRQKDWPEIPGVLKYWVCWNTGWAKIPGVLKYHACWNAGWTEIPGLLKVPASGYFHSK